MLEDYELSKEELFKKYKTSIDGLNEDEVKSRLARDGHNELEEKNKNNIFKIIANQFKDFLVWLLIISAIVSYFVDKTNYIDSLIIMLVVVLNAILGIIQEEKANLAVKKIKELGSVHTEVIRNKKRIKINSKDLVLGDIIILNEGDYISADGRIIESNNLETVESTLTGESIPSKKTSEKITKPTSLGGMKNMIFTSTYVIKGNAKAIVTKIGMDTEIGKVAASIDNTVEPKTPLEKDINKLSKLIGILVIIIALAVYVLELIVSKDILSSFKTAVALAVAAIPEGLQAVITMVLALGILKLSKKKTIVKKLKSVETVGAINIVALDKTGTITTGKLKLSRALNLDFVEDKKILRMAYLSSDLESLDEVEVAVRTSYQGERNQPIKTIPFDSARKMSTLIYKEGNEYVAYTKGAFEVIYHNSINKNKRITDEAYRYAKESYRVLGVSYKRGSSLSDVSSERNMTYAGLILFEDEIRETTRASIEKALQASIIPVMITGDHIETAKAIGRRVGLYKENDLAYTKEMLDSKSDEALKEEILNIKIFARVDPMDKLRIIRIYQDMGMVVAYTGDGVNDAAAIKASNIGIAMGDGSDIAHESADLILMDNSFDTIVKSIEEGRRIFKNIKKTIRYLLSSNIGEVLLIFIAALISIQNKNFGLPLLPIHLLFVNLVTDSLPAIAIGLDNTDDDLLNDKPRKTNKGFFNTKEIFRIVFEGIIMGLITILAYVIGLSRGISHSYGMTMAFITISVTQFVQAYNVNNSSKLKHMFKNKYLNLASVIGFAIVLMVTFVFTNAFKFEKIEILDLAICLLLSLVILLIGKLSSLCKKIK